MSNTFSFYLRASAFHSPHVIDFRETSARKKVRDVW